MVSTFFARCAARAFLASALLAFLSSTHTASAFDFDDVAALARRKARAPYKPPDGAQPAELAALNYDEYRDIRFRPDRAIWRAEIFCLVNSKIGPEKARPVGSFLKFKPISKWI